ncbi:MAG: DUF2953 domain-containing protein [Clostridia bacterium]|nr:DUF2953 domain-containing protein [Clostridia bacterium]
MTGFQIFLTVIFSIVALFVVVLSIPLKVALGYDDKISLSVKYLFIKLNILPTDPNKPKKEKKPKEEKKEEPPKDEAPKEKKPNPIMEMVKANGFDGMMEILGNLGNIFKIFGGKLMRSVVINDAYIYISVGTGDAASTAIRYGKTCQKIYPLMGFLCNNNVVKHHDINVEADFLANKSEGEFFFEMNLCLRKIINSAIGLVVRLLFGVVIKFLQGGKKKKPADTKTNDVNNTASAVQ